MPLVPLVPARLDADQAISFVETLPSDQQTPGRKVLQAVTNQAVGALEWEGFVIEGKHSVPILERARRAYLPKKNLGPGAGAGAGAGLEEDAGGAGHEGGGDATALGLQVDEWRSSSLAASASASASASERAKDGKGSTRGSKSGKGKQRQLSFGFDLEAEDGREEEEEGAALVGHRYRSLGLATDLSFDSPEILQSFRPIYDIDLNPDKFGSLSLSDGGEGEGEAGGEAKDEVAMAAAALSRNASSGSSYRQALSALTERVDKKARGGFLTNADLLFSM
jgi:hypothetical protein